MRDVLTFTTERRGDHVAAVCRGFDSAGNPVEFEIDPPALRANMVAQMDWVLQLNAAETVMQGYIKIGVRPDAAWLLAEPALPADLRLSTQWRSPVDAVDDGVADRGEEMFEGDDDVFGQSFGRQR